MALTLLFDLDDTLLNNDVDVFIPAYFKTLGRHLEDTVAPEVMLPSLLAGTRAMQKNRHPEVTLEEAFDRVFYPAVGQSKELLRAQIEYYYDEVFGGLSATTSPRAEAPGIINQLIGQGHRVIIATNPLFPRKAIHHRLRWAGLDPEQVPFTLITSYEKFHFAKPHPAYFAEILAQCGCPNQPAVMIGNSLQDDLAPASQLGMPVFWVSQETAPLPGGFHPLSAQGALADIPAWLETVEEVGIRQEAIGPAGLLALLRSTAAAFDTLRRDLTGEQLRQRPEPGEWSLAEIFCHLRDVDRDVNIPRFEKVIQEEDPFLAGIDTDPWAEERGYRQSEGSSAALSFIEARRQLAALLEALDKGAWRRPARHAIFGPTDLTELVNFVTIHDRTHVQQASATARQIQQQTDASPASRLTPVRRIRIG